MIAPPVLRNIQLLGSVLMLTGTMGCSKPPLYSIAVSATSERGYGVLLYDFPISPRTSHYASKNLNRSVIRVTPTIPGEWDTLVTLPPFEGFEHSALPNEITINYQLAEISDCKVDYSETPNDSLLGSQHVYYTKYGCNDWKPLPEKRYTKKIDFRNLIRSKELSLAGTKNRSGNRISAVVLISFFDDGEVKLDIENTIHNRWK